MRRLSPVHTQRMPGMECQRDKILQCQRDKILKSHLFPSEVSMRYLQWKSSSSTIVPSSKQETTQVLQYTRNVTKPIAVLIVQNVAATVIFAKYQFKKL